MNTHPVGILIGTNGTGNPHSHYITVQNGIVRNARNGTSACITQNGTQGMNSNLLFKNLEVYNCQVAVPQGMHGIYLTASNSIIEDCIVHDTDGHGIHMYSGIGHGIDNNIVRRNTVYNTGAFGILVGGGAGNVAYNNIVYKNGLVDGGGIRIAYAYSGTNNKVLNNTVYGNTGTCILVNDSTASFVENNICFGNTLNSIVDNGTGTTISNNLTSDPSFVDAAHFNFALQASSAAVNAGMTVSEVLTDFAGTSRPQGGAFDLGAYEYTGAGAPALLQPLATPKNLRQVSTK